MALWISWLQEIESGLLIGVTVISAVVWQDRRLTRLETEIRIVRQWLQEYWGRES